MKKYLPVILIIVGFLVLGGVFLFIRGRNTDTADGEEVALLDLPLSERPIVSLTPTEDGHYLMLKVTKIIVPEAKRLDYVLLYQTGEGVTQGVPGSTDVDGKENFEIDLLLGSESSGKFRYDEGVNEGSITFEFRNREGRLLSKFVSDFNLTNNTDKLISPDNKFSVNLKETSEGFAVVMDSIGIPDMPPGDVKTGPYIIQTSDNQQLYGSVEISGARTFRHVSGSDWSDENTDTVLDSDTNVYVGISG